MCVAGRLLGLASLTRLTGALHTHVLQEECRGWDVNDLVFSAALWGTYQVRLRRGLVSGVATTQPTCLLCIAPAWCSG